MEEPGSTPVPSASPAPSSPTPSPSPEPPPGSTRSSSTGKPRWPVLQFTGFVQIEAEDGSLGSSSRTREWPARSGVGLYPADTTVGIRRLRPTLTAQLNPDVRLLTTGTYDSRSNRWNLLDVSLRWEPQPYASLTVGQFKTPFGWEGPRSDTRLEVIERTDVTRALYPDRDVGVELELRPGPVVCNLGVFNGEGQKPEVVTPRMVIGRVTSRQGPGLHIGGSVQLGSSSRETGELPVRKFGLEGRYAAGPWTFVSECLWSNGYNLVSRASTRAQGWYVLTLYQLEPQTQLLAGFDAFDPDIGRASSTGTGEATNARHRWVLGVNYFPDRSRRHRIAVNYEFHRMTEGTPRSRQGWRAQYMWRW